MHPLKHAAGIAACSWTGKIKKLMWSFHNVTRDFVLSENQIALRCRRLGPQERMHLTLGVSSPCVCVL